MNTYEAVIKRIEELCQERELTCNGLSYCAGVSQSTIKSIMNGESQNPKASFPVFNSIRT